MLRIAAVIALCACTLNSPSTLTSAEKDDGFDALDNFEKDFKVAFGDPKSWKVNDGVLECSHAEARGDDRWDTGTFRLER